MLSVNIWSLCSWPCRSASGPGLEAQPSLRHMAQHAAITLAANHRLECNGEMWSEAKEGTGGCRFSSGGDFFYGV